MGSWCNGWHTGFSSRRSGFDSRRPYQILEVATKSMDTLTCVYCGSQYPEGTPPFGAQILTDHIRVCEKHPMRKLELNNAKLRKALADLVGAESASELEAMEAAIRLLPGVERDKVTALNAIHALQDTST